jgi:hypothetical protein
MPLLDHFHRPLSVRHPWQSVHSAWANAIVQQLNQSLLPERYYALPNVQFGGRFEIDVSTFDDNRTAAAKQAAGGTAVWAPAQASLVVPVDLADFDVVEVQVMDETEGRLVAAIELVSPANKDRPASRQAFAVKAVALLQAGVSIAIIDIVTERTGNLVTELFQLLGKDRIAASMHDLYAIALRQSAHEGISAIEGWPENLSLGAELPVIPLWLSHEFALPLDLEQSYTAACHSLRLHS